jgi:tyrosyl-tRNA synthetase
MQTAGTHRMLSVVKSFSALGTDVLCHPIVQRSTEILFYSSVCYELYQAMDFTLLDSALGISILYEDSLSFR